MATSMCANTATAATSLLQRGVIRSAEPSSTSNLSPWQPNSLRSLFHGYGKSAGNRSTQEIGSKGIAAVKATVTAYRDLDSVSIFHILCCFTNHVD